MKQSAAERRAVKRQGSNTSSFNRAHEDSRAKSEPTEGEVNLRHYLIKLGLPSGLHSAIESAYHDVESRIWIVDNSLDMNVKDCNLILADDKLEKIKKEEGASRWSEQLQCVDFHLKMAARTWIPTKFWMVNNPRQHPQRYGVCWGDPANWSAERDNASQVMLKELRPEQEANPLGPEILKVVKKLEPEADRMEEEGKFVSVVICTQGAPKNERGESSSHVMKDCIINLKALSNLPVKLTFRLCTGNSKVLNFYRKAGNELGLGVLGDYWDEAKNVNQQNPWLTYGIGLHRIREAGLGINALELMNTPMSLNQIYELCTDFFVPDNSSMRHPSKDWDGFIADLKVYLQQETLVWNPVKKKLSPWIDLDKLESIYHNSKTEHSQPAKVSPDSVSDRPKLSSFHEEKQTDHRRRATVPDADLPSAFRKSTSFDPSLGKQHMCRHTEADFNEPPANLRKSTSFHPSLGKQHTRRHTEADADDKEPPATFRRSASVQDPPPVSFRRSAFALDPPEASMTGNHRKNPSYQMPQKAKSFHGRARKFDSPPSTSKKPSPISKKQISFHDPFKSSAVIKEELFESLFGGIKEETEGGKLETLIKEWSHESNGKLRPLQALLFEAPVLLPPNNPLVKHHEYFDKWKVLHRDAFKDEDGDSDDMVQKVARRCKIFLHPDKWPSDLNDDQKFLLQSMWDVFQESELF